MNIKIGETAEKIKKYRHDCLRELYNKCTTEQQHLFNRMYKSVDLIPDENIDWAIQQCERTIKKNAETGE